MEGLQGHAEEHGPVLKDPCLQYSDQSQNHTHAHCLMVTLSDLQGPYHNSKRVQEEMQIRIWGNSELLKRTAGISIITKH